MFGKPKAKPAPLVGAAHTYQQGLAALETGRYSEAIEKLSAIADERSLPGTLARFYLGQAYLQLGLQQLAVRNYTEATRCFTEARRINPDSAGLSRYLVTCHAAEGRYDQAAGEIERQQAAGEPDHQLPIRLAHAYLRDGQFDRAVQTLTDAIHAAPRRSDLRLQLGLMLASADRYDEAINSLSVAAKLSPFDAVIHRHLGLAFGAQQRMSDAVRHLRTAQRLDPQDAYTAQLLTMALQATGESATSDTIRLRAARSDADSEAIEQLGQVIVADPDFVEAFLSLPESEVDAEVFGLLAGTLERALAHHPDYADLHYHCSRVYQRLGRTDAAIRAAGRAVNINPRYVQALILLGRLYSQTDREADAIDRLQEAIASGGDYPDVHYLLGELYRRRGDRAAAKTAYRRALELNSNFERARAALETIEVG